MSANARRDRQLGIITKNRQRYEAELPPDALGAVRAQVCPFCGEGPFQVVARHVYLMHGITSRELRDMLGILAQESICDPMFAKAVAARSVLVSDPSNLLKSVAARRDGSYGGHRMTKAARLAMSERRRGKNPKTGLPARPRSERRIRRITTNPPTGLPRQLGRTMATLLCPQCGNTFTMEKRNVPKGRDPYCSQRCAGLATKPRSSQCPGVGWRSDRKKWRAWVKVAPGKMLMLGHFDTEAEAIAARLGWKATQ